MRFSKRNNLKATVQSLNFAIRMLCDNKQDIFDNTNIKNEQLDLTVDCMDDISGVISQRLSKDGPRTLYEEFMEGYTDRHDRLEDFLDSHDKTVDNDKLAVQILNMLDGERK